MILSELSYSRHIAVEECRELGKPFIQHFHKCMNDIQRDNWTRLNHHACEMQAWWDTVKK